jgi:hypothetical protein
LAIGFSRRRLSLGPRQEFVERRTERLPPLREVILDLRRDLSVHNARHDAVPLQLPKLLGQHLLRDARNRALEVGEAQRLTAKEMEEDDELPATIQLSNGLLDPSGGRRGRVCALTHGCVPHFRVRSCDVITLRYVVTSMSTHAKAPIHLPLPIAVYFAADTSDANAVARCFSESAVVIDERREHRGRPAITRWRAKATAKYHYTSEPLAVDVSGPEVTVTARVTGDFPGSPVALQYRFTLEGASIARLEITA